MCHFLVSCTLQCKAVSNLNKLFACEVQRFTPTLSDFGKLHLPASLKNWPVECLEQPEQSETRSSYDCKILDGAVVVHCLPTITVITFDEYAINIFIHQDTERLDVGMYGIHDSKRV